MRNIIIKREHRRASALAVNDVTFDDVMCIPRGQADGTLFTRPFLSFRCRRGWRARLESISSDNYGSIQTIPTYMYR